MLEEGNGRKVVLFTKKINLELIFCAIYYVLFAITKFHKSYI